MERADERVLGEIAVSVKLSMGFERLRLYFTNQRIIVGHLSKVGAGSVAPTFLFGSIGSALGDVFGRRKDPRAKARSDYPTPGRILASHPDNFSISFGEIIGVDIIHGSEKTSIAILSTNDKFDFTSRSRFELVRSLFENALGEKVKVH